MNLIDAIKANKDVRRIFGKRELVIIEKQLLGVQLKPSEKTRLSRDIRKKFEAIASLIPYKEDFELKHGAIIKERINEAKEAILKSGYLPKINKIILFGSAAENKLTLLSDVDIAVEFKEISRSHATKFRLEILRRVNERVDVQVYNFLPNKIKKEIKEKGKLLWTKESETRLMK